MSTTEDTNATRRGSELSEGLGPAPECDVLAELRAAAARKWSGDPAAQRAGLFSRAAAEIENLRSDLDENAALRERMADLLRRTAVALRGPEPPLTRWGWHDLPERAAAAVAAERARLLSAAEETKWAMYSGEKTFAEALREIMGPNVEVSRRDED